MNDRQQSVISVIIPVYNVEKYLRRCLDSIVQQTYRQLEIVLVDDGSKDQSGLICDEYAKADPRVRTIHKPNGGQSSARNVGLDAASGDYVAYVDSDDFLHPLFCERLLKYAQQYDADIVQCDKCMGTADRFPEQEAAAHSAPTVVSGREALLDNQFKVTVWAKLYAYPVVGQFRFQEGMIHEDDDIYYKYGYAARRVCMAADKLYYYYQSPNSTMRKQTKREGLSLISPIYENRIAYFLARNDRQMVNRSIERYCITLMLMYMDNARNATYAEDQKALYQAFCEQYARIRSDSGISRRTRFLFLTFKRFPGLSSFLADAFRLCQAQRDIRDWDETPLSHPAAARDCVSQPLADWPFPRSDALTRRRPRHTIRRAFTAVLEVPPGTADSRPHRFSIPGLSNVVFCRFQSGGSS